jgi:hypothetical protein
MIATSLPDAATAPLQVPQKAAFAGLASGNEYRLPPLTMRTILV